MAIKNETSTRLLGKQLFHCQSDSIVSNHRMSINLQEVHLFSTNITHTAVASSSVMLRAPAVSKLDMFQVKFSLTDFCLAKSPHTGLANTLSGTAAMVAPDATRSASNAIQYLLLTRALAPARSSMPKPDCFSAQRRPAVHILLKLYPNPRLSRNGAISFIPFPASLLSSSAFACGNDSSPRKKEHLYYYAFPYARSKFISIIAGL